MPHRSWPDDERPRLLVVDDEPAMVRTVERVFERHHRVAKFTEPRKALEAVASGSLRPHVAILDVQMPGIDGFELTRSLKEVDPQLRVILMTGSIFGNDEKLIRAIEEQAFYFIHKPFDRKVLRALVSRCLELHRLESENRRWVAHLENQLEGARAFQQTMLPAPRARIGGLEIHTAYCPSLELAGDLCDYVACSDEAPCDPADDGAGSGSERVRRIALVVADVVGHGASAAMLTAIVKSSFHAARADGYAPEAVVRRVYEGIAAFSVDRFVTLVAARVDLDEQVVELVNAGHEEALIASPLDGEPGRFAVRAVGSTGPLISPAPIFARLRWSTVREPFPPDARLLLTSDGIVETQRDGEELGRGPLVEALARGEHGAELLDTVFDAVERFAPGDASDDRTLLTARHLADR